jgi:TonB family protein
MPKLANRSLQICMAALLLGMFSIGARAQIPPKKPRASTMAAIAAQAAIPLDRYHTKIAVVFDFTSADSAVDMTRLGAKLAADFRTELDKTRHGFHIMDTPSAAAWMNAHQMIAADAQIESAARAMVRETEADSWVVGLIALAGDGVNLTLNSFHRTGDRSSNSDTFEAYLPLTADMRALIDRTFTDEPSSIPTAGTNGITSPSCLYCPAAQYTDDATIGKIQGTTTLIVTVGADGRARDFRVVKHLPFGLSESAIENVKQWKFAPAKDRDGNPVAVRQTIEVQFHLY